MAVPEAVRPLLDGLASLARERFPRRLQEVYLLGSLAHGGFSLRLSDVDAFFYAACYIRAWALETHLRRVLRERFGEQWFDEREAGDFLKQLWRDGQRLPAHELLAELTGEELDFSALLEDLDLVPSP